MARFWVGGGSSTNWNATANTNWAASSGGAGNQTVPDVTQDVTFDGAGSGNGASIISATISCLSLTITSGYTNTMTHNAVLTIAGNWTFHAGYTIAGSSAVTVSASSTIDCNTKVWPNNVTFSGANTKTLAENFTITGTLTVSTTTTITSNTLTIGGLVLTAGTVSGTAAIALTGGTWSGGGTLQNSMTITGTVTVSSGVAYNGGTLTCTSATVTTTGSTLTIAASATLSTSAISWNNVSFTNTGTLTINSILTVLGTFSISTGIVPTFAGTSGWTVGTFSFPSTGNQTVTLVNSVTYTITTAFNCFNSRTGAIVLFTSDHASNKAILTLQNGATCNVLASFTRIDASAGRAIWTFNGVVTTCFNIISLTDLSFVTGRSIVIQGDSNY